VARRLSLGGWLGGAARRRWRALRLRLVAAFGRAEPLLETAGEATPIPARPAAPPPRPAAPPEFGPPEPSGEAAAGIPHPTVVELGRRAALELFRWLGCTVVPPQLWPMLDRGLDPDAAIGRLARSLGVEVGELRARRAAALRRFREGVDLLVDLAALGERLTPEQRRAIEALLRAGELERVRGCCRALLAVGSALRAFEDLPGQRRLRAGVLLVERLEAMLRRPLDLDPGEAEALLGRADRLRAQAQALDALARRADRALEGLRRHWPWAWEGTERALLRERLTGERRRLERLVLASEGGDLEALLAGLEQVASGLERLLGEAWSAATGAGDARAAGPSDEVAAALRFFGLEADPPRDRAALDRARRRCRAEHHPDRYTRAAEKRRHEALFKEIDRHYDALRRRLAA
jgi:hypothetical protein